MSNELLSEYVINVILRCVKRISSDSTTALWLIKGYDDAVFAHAVIKSSCFDVYTIVVILYARYCMLFASEAIIYLNEERDRVAQNNFF